MTTGKLAAGAVATSDIGDDQITADKIATNAVTADGLADNAVDAFAIANGAVTNSKLAPSAVTTAKMATEATQRLVPSGGTQGQVLKKTSNNDYAFGWGTDEQGTGGGGGLTQSQVDARIAAYGNAFTAADEAKLDGIETGATADQTGDDIRNALENLTGASKLPGTVLEDASIGTEQIGDDQITQAKIGPGAVGSTELAANAVTTAKIDGSAVTEAKIDDGAVTTGKIGSLAVQEGKIADGAVTQAKIGNGAVTEGKLGALAVTAAKIAGGAVTLAKAGADLVARLLPTGGTTGQVVTKTATGQEWADAAAGGQTLAETLLDRTAVGVTFSDAGADRLGVPVYFPIGTFDLTGKSGVFFLDIEYAFSGSSITNFGFSAGSPGDATASAGPQLHRVRSARYRSLRGGRRPRGRPVLARRLLRVHQDRDGRLAHHEARQRLGRLLPQLRRGHRPLGNRSGATVTATATLNFLPTEGGGTPGEGPSTPVRSLADYESVVLPSLAATARHAPIAVVGLYCSGNFQSGSNNAAQGVTISKQQPDRRSSRARINYDDQRERGDFHPRSPPIPRIEPGRSVATSTCELFKAAERDHRQQDGYQEFRVYEASTSVAPIGVHHRNAKPDLGAHLGRRSVPTCLPERGGDDRHRGSSGGTSSRSRPRATRSRSKRRAVQFGASRDQLDGHRARQTRIALDPRWRRRQSNPRQGQRRRLRYRVDRRSLGRRRRPLCRGLGRDPHGRRHRRQHAQGRQPVHQRRRDEARRYRDGRHRRSDRGRDGHRAARPHRQREAPSERGARAPRRRARPVRGRHAHHHAPAQRLHHRVPNEAARHRDGRDSRPDRGRDSRPPRRAHARRTASPGPRSATSPTGSIADDAITLDKLADAVAARLVPTGGTANQVLTRQGATGFNWAAAAAGGGGISFTKLTDNLNIPGIVINPHTYGVAAATDVVSDSAEVIVSVTGQAFSLTQISAFYLLAAWRALPATTRAHWMTRPPPQTGANALNFPLIPGALVARTADNRMILFRTSQTSSISATIYMANGIQAPPA